VAVVVGDEPRVFDAAVCALPPARAADVLREAGTKTLLAFCDALAYEPIVTCYLTYPAGIRLPMAMIGMDGELGQWAFDRGALGGPPGQVAVVVSAAGRLREFEAPEMATRIHEELSALVGSLPPPSGHRVISERRATFRCTPGLTRPDHRVTGIDGVVLAGDYLLGDYPATLEAATRAGVMAAESLLA
jgi:predicted NAD/FAD-binding protein